MTKTKITPIEAFDALKQGKILEFRTSNPDYKCFISDGLLLVRLNQSMRGQPFLESYTTKHGWYPLGRFLNFVEFLTSEFYLLEEPPLEFVGTQLISPGDNAGFILPNVTRPTLVEIIVREILVSDSQAG